MADAVLFQPAGAAFFMHFFFFLFGYMIYKLSEDPKEAWGRIQMLPFLSHSDRFILKHPQANCNVLPS